MKEIVLAGFGGQGVLLCGKVLAQAAVDAGLEATWLPSYGIAMRGGSANCTVHISDEEIYSPGADETDILVVLNVPSFEAFKNTVLPHGYLFFNSDSGEVLQDRDDVEFIQVPAAEIASQAADLRSTNFAMLGAVTEVTGLLDHNGMLVSIDEYFEREGKQKLSVPIKAAFCAGYDWAKANL
jgi:2-oxoglutarate ferredoxin oxidoreductase subunit gamma